MRARARQVFREFANPEALRPLDRDDNYSPMYQNVPAAQAGRVNEVVAQGEVLRQVLVGAVGGQDAQIMFVLRAQERGSSLG